jgi:hypothetical protein
MPFLVYAFETSLNSTASAATFAVNNVGITILCDFSALI